MSKKKPLSQQEILECQQLKAAWTKQKSKLGLTQEIAASRLGMSQGGFGHYLHGRNAIGLKAKVDLAKLLQMDPVEIWPDFDLFKQSNHSPLLQPTLEELIDSVSNGFAAFKHSPTVQTIIDLPGGHFAFEVTTVENEPSIPRGSMVAVEFGIDAGQNQFGLYLSGKTIFIALNTGYSLEFTRPGTSHQPPAEDVHTLGLVKMTLPKQL